MNPEAENFEVKHNVLNAGYVKLIDYMGSDRKIAAAARASYHAANKGPAEDSKLILRLMQDRHTSPFEHCVITFEVKAPIFVLRQWHRHRTWSYSEQSGRYAVLQDEFYIPERDKVGKQTTINKQGRSYNDSLDPNYLIEEVTDGAHECYDSYVDMIGKGYPRELARLNVHNNVYVTMWATVDLHNLIHFLTLRMDQHAQYEIRMYAAACQQIAGTLFPCAMACYTLAQAIEALKNTLLKIDFTDTPISSELLHRANNLNSQILEATNVIQSGVLLG